jgi:hypothetical protein
LPPSQGILPRVYRTPLRRSPLDPRCFPFDSMVF